MRYERSGNSFPTGGTASEATSRPLVVLAWVLVLGETTAPQAVAREGFGVGPDVVLPAQVALLIGFLGYAAYDPQVRPLAVLAASLLVVQLQFHAPTAAVAGYVGVAVPDGAWSTLAHEVLEFATTAVFAVGLFVCGRDRDALFLRSGDRSAPAASELLPAVVTASWRRFGIVVGAPLVAGTAAFLWAAVPVGPLGRYAAGELAAAALLIVAVAAMNAFSEEFVFRAAPLADLRAALGGRHALFLLAGFFGLSHYYGTPGGPVGVGMAAFLGWALAKSMLETRGIAVAWSIHFLLDVLIFSALLL